MNKRIAKKIVKEDRERLRNGVLSTGRHTKDQVSKAYRILYRGFPLLPLRFPMIRVIGSQSLLNLTQEFEEINRSIALHLGVPEAFLTGSTEHSSTGTSLGVVEDYLTRAKALGIGACISVVDALSGSRPVMHERLRGPAARTAPRFASGSTIRTMSMGATSTRHQCSVCTHGEEEE